MIISIKKNNVFGHGTMHHSSSYHRTVNELKLCQQLPPGGTAINRRLYIPPGGIPHNNIHHVH